MAPVAQQAVNLNVNHQFWDTSRVIRAACLVSGVTLFLTSTVLNKKPSNNPSELPWVNKTIEWIGKSIKESPEKSAIALGALSLTPEMWNIAKGICRLVKYCIYDEPILGASMISSGLTAAGMTYGPDLLKYLKLKTQGN